ncbi:MAG: phosphatase PAP2 family protein [Candidatus Mcinerneyibacterium aminivorans]|jgi:diacylglycerol kinase (ATP)|uniref:Phosphatase PAP2 family protein n=1 Tax=Candidatus Mcinerneyibacterium aminivorans TaxID=2703815 RepID=A0A5D0MCD6_9BACT|nr:MAG: phosphatase PAP2 family protein [Candidatus Mcinerneyibacterium aminivorans]
MKKNNNLLESFNNAVKGIILSIKYERNIKIHYLIALLVLAYSLFLDLTFLERLMLYFSIAFVIVAETFNTVIELIIDYFISTLHDPLIKIIKDISSAGVFIAAINSIIVGYFLVYKKSIKDINALFNSIKTANDTFIFIILIIIITSVVLLKSISKSGKPFYGGWPSGHSAFAFAIAAISILYIDIIIINILIIILAFLVAKSRIDLHIHSLWQVITGSLLGFFLTVLINNIIGGLS